MFYRYVPGLEAVEDTNDDDVDDGDNNEEMPAESAEAELSKCPISVCQKS